MLNAEEISLVRKVKKQKDAGRAVSRKDAQSMLDLMKREDLPMPRRAIDIAVREGFNVDGIRAE